MIDFLLNLKWLFSRVFDHVKMAHIIIVIICLLPWFAAFSVPASAGAVTGMMTFVVGGFVLWIYGQFLWNGE